MKLIASVDNNWGIGYKGRLLVSIPSDQRFFKNETVGKTVVLGRRTLDTFPGGRPLAERENIILTRDHSYTNRDAVVVHGKEELEELLKERESDEVYIIGGQSVYEQFIDRCDIAFITKIDYEFAADSFLPNLDDDPEWECSEESEEKTYYDLCYRFCTYVRKKRNPEA
ncbi:MAG: dihydrofolate reductase [Lachnospiraceae bacterium]|nr:dihydrofolate reductase [Lachnospiraceae bacterium]